MQKLVATSVSTVAFSETSSSPWFNCSLKDLNSKKKRLFQKAKTAVCNLKWDKFYTVDRQYRTAIKMQKQTFHNTDLPCRLKNNPKTFSKVINPKYDTAITLRNDVDKIGSE